ncbi:ribosome maturation factor RimP [Streptococcus pacificus]|uniref:Ribosome maturation factor RimP n=1 Tax=Streptococcus pacificus TaxID=2740577 RepID=A0ABS0ZGG3_9STRE|nr:ribosome maturation factor RimP [Streptococcus pacificus]MBJ8325117.1 ribosome maturation factor RimP [Streptococcus pacificus]
MCKEVNNIATIVELVTDVISPAIKEPFELVDVEYEKMRTDYVLRILIDKPGGITVEDTSLLSEMISPLLDEIKPDPFPAQYMLEVSSPGLERPLKTKDSLSKAIDHYINVSLYQAIDKMKVIEGVLTAFDGETLTLTYMDKTREKTITIPYKAVAKARLAVKL